MTQLGALNERLQSKLEQDKQRIEQIANAELESLQKSLSEASQNALSTIESAIAKTGKQIEQQCGALTRQLAGSEAILSKAVFRVWLRSLLIGSGCLMAVALTTWMLISRYESKADGLELEISHLELRRNALREEVELLHRNAWGVQLVESKEGRFIILPQKKNLQSGWKIGQNPAWRLE